MDLIFDRGTIGNPKGHALLYFRNRTEPDDVWATYVVILPIMVDVTKYVPPFLMDQVAQMGQNELSAFAFPPAPERLGNYELLREIADKRDDDVICLGVVDPGELPKSMTAITEAVQNYANLYNDHVGVVGHDFNRSGSEGDTDDESGLEVSEVLYGLMSDAEKLEELTRLMGRLRFAVEGSDDNQVAYAEKEVMLLSKHLPDNHDISRLVHAVKLTDAVGQKLADLYLQRCFHLVREEYINLAAIDEKLKALESGGSTE